MADASAIATLARYTEPGTQDLPIAPAAQRGPDQAVGLRISAAPPAFPQVGPDLPGGGRVELAVDVGLDLGAQS